METNINEITINGKVYVEKSTICSNQIAQKTDGMDYVIIRTYSAGVHAGYLKSRQGKEVVLVNSRRLYYWNGAATLSQMAIDGVTKPNDCKFTVVVPEITLTESIEIIPCSQKAKECLEGVKVWKM